MDERVKTAIDAAFESSPGVPKVSSTDEQRLVQESETMNRKIELLQARKMEDEHQRRMKNTTKDGEAITTTVMMTSDECEEFINRKMEQRMKGKSWTSLDRCKQWQLICEYVSSLDGLDADEKSSMLSSAKTCMNDASVIKYDKQTQKVVKLNMT